ncbi:ABC transporter permease [Bifidobacterium dolichotidis]|uniref:ABC transporter permease n=1 Tax=Bifidobacterium dolichotidis TaxID=2306976 RepID=A0A430FQV3_9BIFI|nr:ABC transporter permease [Bifidobacterium dolichotidis]RSX55196.1 ABC transporter permease [Bifidobacterium dolichotidis]
MARHKHKHAGATVFNAAYWRDTLRTWKHAIKPFLSLMIIAMLGVAVLTGIYAGCRDSFLAADRYYKEQGLHDLQIISTQGLDENDVRAVEEVPGVAQVQPERSQNVTVEAKGASKTAVVHVIGQNGMDQPSLQAGRLPDTSGEAAVTGTFMQKTGLKIGDTMQIEVPDGAAVTGIPKTLTIVGEVLPADDLANPDGYRAKSSFRATANTALPIYVTADGIGGEAYTALSLTVDGAKSLDSFSDAYDDAVDVVRDRIEGDVKTEREQARADSLKQDAQHKLDEAKQQVINQATQQALDQARAQMQQQMAAQMAAQGGAAAAAAGTTAAGTAGAVANAELPQQVQEQVEREAKEQVEQRFAEEQSKIDAIKPGTWYVQTRAALSGVSSLDSDISSIEKIGNAFPIVFLIVAVMMSLTTMTRLVEEDRGFMGTYLGLGYGGGSILARYLAFAVLAGLIGGGLGLLAGFLGIPAFLLVVIKGLYAIPDVGLHYDWLVGSAGVLLFTVGLGVAAAVAVVREARLMPAVLMRPKAPKAGMRILLEHIKPVWKRMNFLNKVTARNIFRFKSRLIMTLGGVAGCTALIICGLAINDTVNRLGGEQFQGVYRYDLAVVASETHVLDELRDSHEVTKSMNAHVESGTLEHDGMSTLVQIVVVPEGQEQTFADMFELRPESCGTHACASAVLSNNGVIATRSGVQNLNVHAGSTVDLQVGSGKPQQAHVDEVVRNLIGADVYMSQQFYEQHYVKNDANRADEGPEWNAVYADLNVSNARAAQLAEELGEDHAVLSAASAADQAARFKFDLMFAIVILITSLAGALALVVLFTLANTNVSERLREIATLKVLGFTDREVHHYVNREMRIITIMGIVLGLPLGWWISGMLTSALNMPGMYFEVWISPWSYVFAVAATMLFALIVQLFVNPVLDRVDPVTSLKSVE